MDANTSEQLQSQVPAVGVSHLCIHCKKIFKAARCSSNIYLMTCTLQDTKVSAQQGKCEFCRLLCNSIQWSLEDLPDDVQTRYWFANEELYFSCESESTGTTSGMVSFDLTLAESRDLQKPCLHSAAPEKDRSRNTQEEIKMPASSAIGRPGLRFLPHIFDEPCNDSVSSFEIMRGWIKACETEHVACHRKWSSRGVYRLPTRLISFKIGDRGLGEKTQVRLCTPQDENMLQTRYVTLSHRWASHPIFETTLGNIDAFKKRINIDLIPAIFMQGMQIATELDVFYIWIDSLCIIQDSEEDWRRESANMGSIYSNSYCSIAATNDSSREGACFAQRSRVDMSRVLVSTQFRGEGEALMFCDFSRLWQDNIVDAPLLHRAWVTQEIILSPRTLHFAKHQAYWECLELRACEEHPDGLPINSLSPLNYINQKPDLWALSSQDQDPTKVVEIWLTLLKMYTAAQLSHPEKDKLIAVSSLAQTLGPASGYRAGLWYCKDVFLDQLLWRKRIEMDNGTVKRRAPSWSWASIDEEVILENLSIGQSGSTRPMAEVINVEVRLEDSQYPFGKVESGRTTLAGPLGQAKLVVLDGEDIGYANFIGTRTLQAEVFSDQGRLPEKDEVFFAPIQYAPGRISGLLLQNTARISPSRGGFKRIGRFHVDSFENVELLMAMSQKPLTSQQEVTEEALGERPGIPDAQTLDDESERLSAPIKWYKYCIY